MPKKIEKVIDVGNSIEVYENDIEMYIDLYCQKYNILDLRKETQNVFNGCLGFIRRHVFTDRRKLKMDGERHEYNMVLIDRLCDLYITLCDNYDKIICFSGFCTMTGIDSETLNGWGYNNGIYDINSSTEIYINNNNNINDYSVDNNGCIKASVIRLGVWKKLKEGYERSLENRLVTGNKNPIGTIATLKHRFGWESPYQATKTVSIETRSPEQIAQSYGKLTDNSNADTMPD